MFQQMSKPGKIFFFISLFSLIYGIVMAYIGFSGIVFKNYGDWLFIYYALQVILAVVMTGTFLIHNWFSQADLKPVLMIVYINIVIYCVLSICFGTFYVYVVDMAGLVADMLNAVFLVCIIFWFKEMMG